VQIAGERSFAGNWGRNLPGVDLAEVVAAGREILEKTPLTFAALGKRLAEKWPDRDGPSMAQAVRVYAALVQLPPRGLWGHSGLAVHTTAEQWLDQSLDPHPSVETLMLRYLAAFGPATANDACTWSGLTRLGEVFDRLRPRLRTFVDERGRELFDLPDAPRPDPDTPAPVRFLYDFDNLLLSHADRDRVSTPEFRRAFARRDGPTPGAVLVDGITAGHWTLVRERDAATLSVHPHRGLTDDEAAAVAAEAGQLLDFAAPEVEREVRLVNG
jgi:DNA glycosylase AlkZ-like